MICLVKIQISSLVRKIFMNNLEVTSETIKGIGRLLDSERRRVFALTKEQYFEKLDLAEENNPVSLDNNHFSLFKHENELNS